MLRKLFTILLVLASVPAHAIYEYYDTTTPETYLADIGTPPACDYVINSDAGWAQINNAAYRVFCVAPGDYSAVGRITITADGTAELPRWIRYYDATGETGADVHPYAMTSAKRARVESFYFNWGNYWIVDRIYIQPRTSFASEAILTNQSDHNIFNRLFITDMKLGVVFYNGSSYNTIQHSVVSDMRHGSDGDAFHMHGRDYDGSHPVDMPQFNRVISNECFDVNDCVHLSGNNPSVAWYSEEDYRGTIVYDNDFYLTTASYTDCIGNYTPSGDCACKENATDIKSGSASATDPVIFAHNRMWGWTSVDSGDATCTGPSGDPRIAATTVIHYNVANFRYEGNVIWGKAGNTAAYAMTDSNFSGNLIQLKGTSSVVDYRAYGWLLTGSANGLTLEDNVLSEINGMTTYRPYSFSGGMIAAPTATITNSVHINSNDSTGDYAGSASGNKYYNTNVPSWDTAPAVDEESVTGSGYDNQFCTTIKRLTNPTQQCFDNALYVTGAEPPTAPTGVRIID